ncbi:MaoC family dehydratase [Streptomyces sp. NBC_01180]|uniref:MaoC family dehydratase n=1 Tax=Streptomyces sp. NBC_01180 TaxID=2903763 RepID=UPI003870119D|nr:MaoC/PaaZ C-terminal domain-containing protein [Streptomyces sp. NBC_01180]
MSDRPTHSPGLLLSMVRGAVASPFKRVVSAEAPLPATRLVRGGARIDPGRLASYSRVCGFDPGGPLPLAYPHVLGFPLAMRLMTARAFPLPVLGLVHTGIEITQRRALDPRDEPELTVYANELRPHRRGTEAVMVTEARLAGELVWESRSRYLARHPMSAGSEAMPRTDNAQPHPAAGAPAAIHTWDLPADLGRRYGAASGDRNPIHLHPLTARLFGFPRAIAHGMWTAARCLAAAEAPEVVHVRVEFRAPVLLPGTVTYVGGAGAFQVLSQGADGAERIHLTGVVTAPSGPRS